MTTLQITYKSGYKETINALTVQFKSDNITVVWSDGTPYGHNTDNISFDCIEELEVDYE